MKGADHTGPLVAAMFLGWPFAQLAQNRGIAERPLATAFVALTAVGIAYLCVFRPVNSAVRVMQGSPSRARTILRAAVAIVLLVLIASASARIAEAWDSWSMVSGSASGGPPLLVVTVLAAGFGAIGSIPGLARLVLASNLGSCFLLLASLLWFASHADAPPQIDEIHWSWTLDGLAYIFPAMAVAGAATAIIRQGPGRTRIAAWVVCAAGYSITLSLLIQDAAMRGYYLNQLDQFGTVVNLADSETEGNGLWTLLLSLTGCSPAIAASFALRELAGRRTPLLIMASTWAWTLERALGWGEGPIFVVLILSLILSLAWAYLAGGFLFGRASVEGRFPTELLSRRRMELRSAIGVSLLLLILIALAAWASAYSASGAGWVAILAPFVGAVAVGGLAAIRRSASAPMIGVPADRASGSQ